MVVDHYCNTIHCPTCIRAFWVWAEQHTRGRPRQRRGPQTAESFLLRGSGAVQRG